jgi:hypothetical protein
MNDSSHKNPPEIPIASDEDPETAAAAEAALPASAVAHDAVAATATAGTDTTSTSSNNNKPDVSASRTTFQENSNKGALDMAARIRKQQALDAVVDAVEAARAASSNHRVPDGLVGKLCAQYQLNRTDIYNEFRSRKKKRAREEQPIVVSRNNKGGRPKNVISKDPLEQANRRRLKSLKSQALTWIAQELLEIKEQQRSINSKTRPKLPSGAMKAKIAQARKQFNLPDSMELKEVTIYERMSEPNNKIPKTPGATSPMLALEPLLVELCLMRQRLGEPFNSTSFLELINQHYVLTPDVTQSLVEFQQRMHWRRPNNDPGDNTSITALQTLPSPKLTKSYYQGFVRRNFDALNVKLGSRLGHPGPGRWAKWTHPYETLQTMYERVFASMVEARVLKQMSSSSSGYQLLDDSNLFFVEDLGNTVDVANNLWTIMGVTAGDGSPVLCCVVLLGHNTTTTSTSTTASSDSHSKQRNWLSSLFDRNSALNDEQDDNTQTSPSAINILPGGPVCTFLGKQVPCYVATTPHSCITGSILMECLRVLDELQFSTRSSDHSLPFCLLDGNFSEFTAPLLQYVTDKTHPWIVCAGLPYRTCHFWKEGDPNPSRQQSHDYKLACQRALKRLMELKRPATSTMPCRLGVCSNQQDLVEHVQQTFTARFANKANNKRILLERGWKPPSRSLLSDPILLATKRFEESSSSTNGAGANPLDK